MGIVDANIKEMVKKIAEVNMKEKKD